MALTEAQFKRRKKGLGASDVSAVFGTSPYKTWLDLFNQKAHDVYPEKDEGLEEFARWGEIMEPVIATEYARRLGRRGVVVPSDTLQHPEITWALATPDRLIHESGPRVRLDDAGQREFVEPKPGAVLWGLEIKNRSYNDKPRWADNHVPAEVATQAHWGMFVTGLPRWDVAALIGGNDFRVLTLKRDDELLGAMQRAAEVFWQGVAAKEPPEMGWVQEEREFIQRRLVNDSDVAAFNRAAYWRKRKGQ